VNKTAALCVDGVEDEALVEAARDILASSPRIEAWCGYGDEAGRLMTAIRGRHHAPPPPPPHANENLDAEQAHAIAERGVAILTNAGFSATMRTLSGRDPGHAIAGASAPDLIVILAAGHRRERGPKSIGHVARFVIDHAAGPVLVLRIT
jgi:nucleotide-binding universal stress UspA family protein